MWTDRFILRPLFLVLSVLKWLTDKAQGYPPKYPPMPDGPFSRRQP